MTRKYWIPLIYTPKIPGLRVGKYIQTFRAGRRFKVGDLVAFHGWEGVPYHSNWSWRTPFWPLYQVDDILIFRDGIKTRIDIDVLSWTHPLCDLLALLDGIDPPTGAELQHVLTGMHQLPDEGKEFQVIRWRYE